MTPAQQQTISYVLSLLISESCGVCLLVYLYKFYALRNDMLVINRRGNIVIAIQICCIIILCIGWPLSYVRELMKNPTSSVSRSIMIIEDLFINPFAYLHIFFIVARYWLIYYDLQFANSCLYLEWKQCIQSDITYLQDDKWYIRHRQTYGNQRYIMTRTTIFSITVSCISLTLVYLYELNVTTVRLYYFLNALILPFQPIILVVLARKLPTFYDNIRLHKEALLITYSSCFLYVIYFSVAIASVIFGRGIWVDFTIHGLAMTEAFVIPFLSTFWVLSQIESIHTEYQQMHDMAHLQLVNILKEEELLIAFIQHLIKEFSLESILALIEMNQFKMHLMDTLQIDEELVGDHILCAFAESTPRSDIVYTQRVCTEVDDEATKILVLKETSYLLYVKYVKSAAQFEINIDYCTQQQLNDMMDDYQAWMEREVDTIELLKVFDECMVKLVRLLNGSKNRFEIDPSMPSSKNLSVSTLYSSSEA